MLQCERKKWLASHFTTQVSTLLCAPETPAESSPAGCSVASMSGFCASEEDDEEGDDGRTSYTPPFCVSSLTTDEANDIDRIGGGSPTGSARPGSADAAISSCAGVGSLGGGVVMIGIGMAGVSSLVRETSGGGGAGGDCG